VSEREVLAGETQGRADGDDRGPLLARLNERGIRLLHLADLLALYGIVQMTMLVRFGTPPWPSYPVALYQVSFAVTVLIFMASVYFGGLYEREPRLASPPALPRVARQTLAAGGLVALLNLAATGAARQLGIATARAFPMPITNLIVLIVLGAIALTVNRRLVQLWRTHRDGPPKVLLVGSAPDREVARTHLKQEPSRAAVAGETDDLGDLLASVERLGVTDVVLLDSRWLDVLYPSVLSALDTRGVTVLLRVSAMETMYGLERVRELGGMPFVLLRAQTMPVSRTRFKRSFDVVTTALLAPLWLPLLVLVAIYQVIVAGRPLLYRQVRVGLYGRPFEMIKFRTMGLDAEAARGAQLAERDDPRVIPACRWIRATRLDELPQFLNILRGEMSLVGPRPERPELTAAFEREIPGYVRRYEIPPGLTGLAQIHGRYHTDPEYKLGYDLQYLVNWSPVLDLEILARTLWVVVARRS
jgi:exopolysaccharide biosynthesis polyprenyl glycosylphosphotransferase